MIHPRSMVSTADIAGHYDELDPMYRGIWGEHVHHGYWRTGRESTDEAVTALARLVADKLDLSPGLTACDIGCGYGATARMLAEHYGLRVTGLTISTEQARHAERTAPRDGDVVLLVRDWLANSFADASFDRAYAIESSEHMPDKQRFFDEALRTLKPGGVLVVCAWLATEQPRGWEKRHLLEPICREGMLPGMGSENDYRAMARAAGFTIVDVEDVSRHVRRTWALCLRRVAWKLLSDRSYLRYLLKSGARNRVFLLTLIRLLVAYRTGSMRYCIFVLAKPF